MVGRKKFRTFEEIKGKAWSCISNWKNTFISQARKEVLFKFVVQAISTYTMSLFQLSRKICHQITSYMSHFWWGNMNKQRGVHWRRWELLGDIKIQGRLGFRDIEAFNKALLAKQIWHVLQNPSSLASQILRAKYFPFRDIMTARTKPSLIWWSLHSSINFVREGMFWKIGTRHNVRIWHDKWLPLTSFKAQSPISLLPGDTKVTDLIEPATHSCNCDLISKISTRRKLTLFTKSQLASLRQWTNKSSGQLIMDLSRLNQLIS